MAHTGQSHLPNSSNPLALQGSNYRNVSNSNLDKDPSGSDDSLIDISEESLPHENRQLSVEGGNRRNVNSRKETAVDLDRGSPQQQTSANSGLLLTESKNGSGLFDTSRTTHGQSNVGTLHDLNDNFSSRDRSRSSYPKEVKDSSGNLLHFSASDAAPSYTRSSSSKAWQEFPQDHFRSQLLQAQLEAGHQPTAAGRTADQFFLGDPTFAGSFSPRAPNPATDWPRDRGGGKGIREPGDPDPVRSDRYPLAEPIDLHLTAAGHATGRTPADGVPSSSGRPSSSSSGRLVISAADDGDHRVDGGWRNSDNSGGTSRLLDSNNSATSGTCDSSMPFDRGWCLPPPSRDNHLTADKRRDVVIRGGEPLVMGDNIAPWQTFNDRDVIIRSRPTNRTPEDVRGREGGATVTSEATASAGGQQRVSRLQGYESATARDASSSGAFGATYATTTTTKSTRSTPAAAATTITSSTSGVVASHEALSPIPPPPLSRLPSVAMSPAGGQRGGGGGGGEAASGGTGAHDSNYNRPMAFQRNPYGEYAPLPYASLHVAATFDDGDDGDDQRQQQQQDHHSRRWRGISSGGAMGGGRSYRRHCHRANASASVDKVAKRQLVAVVGLCLTFMVGEAVGGALSNSLALFTDVLHLGSDLVSFLISLFALYLSNKGATKTMAFGYHRAEVLGALFSVFLIWLVSGVLCYIAVERIVHEHYKDVKADEMLITASLGVVFNITMAIVLHSEWCCKGAHSHTKFGHGHSHGGPSKGHGHSSQGSEYEPLQPAVEFEDEYMERRDFEEDKLANGDDRRGGREGRQGGGRGGGGGEEEEMVGETADGGHGHSHQPKNLNVRAAFIHVVGDIIQSLGVLVAALIIKLQPDEKYRLADPICTFLFSVLVLITTIAVLRDTISVLMEAVPRDLSHDKLKRELLSLDGVVMVHSLHIWALTISRNAVAVHLAVDDPRIHDQVLSSATYLIQTRYQFYYSTIQVELYDPQVMTSCQKCLEFEK